MRVLQEFRVFNHLVEACANGGDTVCGNARRGHDGTRGGFLREEQLHHLAVCRIFHIVHRQRHILQVRHFFGGDLQEDPDLLVTQEIGLAGLHVGPRPIAHALHLAALHSEHRFRGTLVPRDDLEFCTQQRIQHARRCFGVDMRAGATDEHFLLHHVFDFQERRCRPHDHHRGFRRKIADPVEFRQVETHALRIGEFRRKNAALQKPHRGAVFRRHVIDLVGGGQRSGTRQVLHDDGRIAGEEPANMA